jgi:nanoRNase/pAp phosphatase (c-di-AMP/oligoRNAs hydrolase)
MNNFGADYKLELDLDKEILKLENYLKNSKKILLINHRRMDGDAFGSLCAFYYILKSL